MLSISAISEPLGFLPQSTENHSQEHRQLSLFESGSRQGSFAMSKCMVTKEQAVCVG